MRYETEVDIDASPETVWSVLTDVERWPEWTESVTSVRLLGDGAFGAGATARVKQPRLPSAVWTVTAFEPGRNFTWASKSPGITTSGGHILVPREGGVTVRLTIDQSGPLAGLAGRLTSGLTRRYVEMEAQGLKRRAESRR